MASALLSLFSDEVFGLSPLRLMISTKFPFQLCCCLMTSRQTLRSRSTTTSSTSKLLRDKLGDDAASFLLTFSPCFLHRENLPGHFKFKEYCPQVFRNLRERFGIEDLDYQVCGADTWCHCCKATGLFLEERTSSQ